MSNQNNFIYGINPVTEHLKKKSGGVLFIKKGGRNPRIQEIISTARQKKVEISFIPQESFVKFFGEINHQGVVLKLEERIKELLTEKDFLKIIDNDKAGTETLLILDSVKDPGNLGAILRSALLFNVNYVILPKNNSAPINETVAKRSAGALTHINMVSITNISRTMEELKKRGYWTYVADMNGTDLKKADFAPKSVIIMGEEGKGVRPLIRENSDFTISIPTNSKLDSLNLSVSTAIILYERFIQLS